MKKINFKFIIITMIVCLLPLLLGLTVYNQLPDKLAVHFNVNNEPDNYFPKAVVVFSFPIVMSLLQLICCVLSDIFEREKNNKFEKVAKLILPIMTIILYTITISYNLNFAVDMRKIVCLLIGIIIILLGNYIPKIKAGGNFNVYPRKLINDEKIWAKYSRILGYTYVILGILLVVSILLEPIFSVITVVLFILVNIIDIIYSLFFLKAEK